MSSATGSRGVDRAILWLVLSIPLAAQTWRFAGEQIYYGEYLHWSGQWGARLLIATLAVTSLRRLLPRAAASLWLVRRRRDLGLITFAYAAAHTFAYLAFKADFVLVAGEAMEAGLLTGWIAGLVMLVLALTSNDASVRRLGRGWRSLHRTVHAVAILTFAHWILTAFDPQAGWLHAGALAVLLLPRLLPRRSASRSGPTD